MQSLQDIFNIWPSIDVMAEEIKEKRDTVYRWRLRGRIPTTAWGQVIMAAAERGVAISTSQIFSLNQPMKKRGRAA
jgi:hypothetical protein